MKRNSTLLIGVLYNGIAPFLQKYFKSLDDQSINIFDVLILNDGYKDIIPPNKQIIHTINIDRKTTPAEVRQFGIQFAIENNYENLIFSDADDYYSENYVGGLIENLCTSDFVYSNIVPVDSKGSLNNNNFLIPNYSNNYCNILKYNYIGLGSSAVKTKHLNNIEFPSDIIAFDWLLYTTLLINGFSGKLVSSSYVYYRQHTNNTVGGLKKLNSERLLKVLDIKEKHYLYFYNYCSEKNFEKESFKFEQMYKEMKNLQLLLKDNQFKNKYIRTVNSHIKEIYKGWWSEIITIEEYKKYAN
jgi:hypothetical protein